MIRNAIYLIGLIFLLSACGGATTPSQENTSEASGALNVKANIAGYTGQEGQFDIYLQLFDFDFSKVDIGDVSFMTDGSFELNLTADFPDEYLKNGINGLYICPDSVVSNPDFKGISQAQLSLYKEEERVGDLLQGEEGKGVWFFYLDDDVSITGSCTVPLVPGAPPYELTYQLAFKKGWNLVIQSGDEGSLSFRTAESSTLPWLFIPKSSVLRVRP